MGKRGGPALPGPQVGLPPFIFSPRGGSGEHGAWGKAPVTAAGGEAEEPRISAGPRRAGGRGMAPKPGPGAGKRESSVELGGGDLRGMGFLFLARWRGARDITRGFGDSRGHGFSKRGPLPRGIKC